MGQEHADALILRSAVGNDDFLDSSLGSAHPVFVAPAFKIGPGRGRTTDQPFIVADGDLSVGPHIDEDPDFRSVANATLKLSIYA
jgi:hypothetical protein